MSANETPVIVKRYARTRLYDSTNGHYVSIDQLRRWAREGVDFVVTDTETREDITQILLA
jgi:polyhydroxyalkanoate synthesis regulator protein